MNITEKPMFLLINDETDNTLSLPPFVYEHLKNTGSLPNKLAFGTAITDVHIISHDEQKESICYLTNKLAKTLSIPFNSHVRLYVHDNVLHIGPLIGIFTAGFTNNLNRPVGDRTSMFAQYLTSAAKLGGFCFIFGSHVINWDDGTILGYVYTEKGWKQQQFPFPHVVYDRIPNRKAEQLPKLQTIKSRMQTNYFIPWFNSGFFNKWTIYKKLFTNEYIRQHLPKTVIDPSIETIEQLLNDYKHVYMKPVNGSLGLGIFHIIKREKDQLYYCRFKREDKTVVRRYSNLATLIEQHLPSENRSQFVVQQGVTLIKINDRPVDFRVHTNKNIHGQWKVSAIAAKVSGPNRITTHLASGGSVHTIEELIAEHEQLKPHIEKLKNVTLLLSEALEEKMTGFTGEFGFDMGIDNNGNIWMFEANSKPGRAIFIHPKLKKADLVTRQLPFEFGAYLTEKIITKPETVLS